jgi:hypothetical protein
MLDHCARTPLTRRVRAGGAGGGEQLRPRGARERRRPVGSAGARDRCPLPSPRDAAALFLFRARVHGRSCALLPGGLNLAGGGGCRGVGGGGVAAAAR